MFERVFFTVPSLIPQFRAMLRIEFPIETSWAISFSRLVKRSSVKVFEGAAQASGIKNTNTLLSAGEGTAIEMHYTPPKVRGMLTVVCRRQLCNMSEFCIK